MGGVRILAQYLHHPAMTLGYRIEADGASVVYLCDHEPFAETLSHESVAPGDDAGLAHEGDRRHARFMADAGLVIHDAQYTPEEFAEKRHWGHCTVEYAVEVARLSSVKTLCLFHHDPSHGDDAVDRMLERALRARNGSGPDEIVAAAEGLAVSIGG
jgi:ribonuclease BN (tRNA processing enzyme)